MSSTNQQPNTSGPEVATTYTRYPMESGGNGSQQAQPPQAAASSADGSALIAAREEERIRLAEELHDGTAQALANALFQVEIIEKAWRDHPDETAAELGALRTILEREMNTLRAYINQLRPSLGEPTSLDEALRDTVESITERTALAVDIQLTAPAELLGQAGRTTVLRVAQEALRNAAKHSGARHLWLATRTEPRGAHDCWILEVRDDGVGFDLVEAMAHADRRHFGLRFMRERADLLGSQLDIATNSTSGTVVRLTIDLGGDRR
jgi:two-component system, NarL family, sensor histidine kinase DegS